MRHGGAAAFRDLRDHPGTGAGAEVVPARPRHGQGLERLETEGGREACVDANESSSEEAVQGGRLGRKHASLHRGWVRLRQDWWGGSLPEHANGDLES